MKSLLKILSGVLISTVVLLASILVGGRYEMRSVGEGGMVRMDRWTGKAMVCVPRRCVMYPTARPDPLPPPELKMN